MIRIWARTTVENKIILSYIYESIDHFSVDSFRLHIEKICHELDLPTPIVLKTHINNYDEFGTVTFYKNDFVESVEFEKFILENAVITH